VLVVSPHYYGAQMTPAVLEAHFRRVADESPIPVLLYNIPKYAHLTLEPELVATLSAHENIVGMKDSAGDLVRLKGYIESQRADFSVITGHGGSFHKALEMGVRGGILAVALFAVELSMEVWRRFRAGDATGAAEAQAKLTPLAQEIVAGLGVPGVKAAIDQVGLRGGPLRSPLVAIPQKEDARIMSMLASSGVGHAVPVAEWAGSAAART
jgi:4-hydroxy-2-oxoglutarate aldolase